MTALALQPPVAPRAASARPLRDPTKEMRVGLSLIALFAAGFVGWASFVRLDAAIHEPGVVRVAGNRQTVQSAQGGVIGAIRVREGQQVKAGQVLVDFTTAETLAQERSLATRVFALQAEIARIHAEQRGAADVAVPAAWARLSPSDRAQAEQALAAERGNLAAERGLLRSQRAVLQQQIAQTGDQIRGYGERLASTGRQGRLNEEELRTTQQLFDKGYATKSRVLALQRSSAAIDGELGATSAEIARLRTQAGETRLQMMQLSQARLQQNAERLRAALTELNSYLPQWKAAGHQVAMAQVRAPVSGAVLALAANTVGGVVPAGGRLLDIVPADGALVVETRVSPEDANEIAPGQPADIHVAAIRGRPAAELKGVVARVSDDSLADERSGQSFFSATVRVPRSELARVARAGGAPLRSGTPVQVTVPLERRTALRYWLEPLTRRLAPAMSER